MEIFRKFFQDKALYFLKNAIKLALEEDEEDVTSLNLFSRDHQVVGVVVAKEDVLVAGLPIISMIFDEVGWPVEINFLKKDGDLVKKGTELVEIKTKAFMLLTVERTILNFLCHLSGIATYTARFVNIASKYGVVVLDTRKSLPGLRYPEKYAVLIGGGENHRFNLSEMVMVKDTHIDGFGSLTKAVKRIKSNLIQQLKVVVECRNLKEVEEAVKVGVDRIMLDNMNVETAKEALKLIPPEIETEISGGIDISNIEEYAELQPNYISIGRIIHSAKYADLSMKIKF